MHSEIHRLTISIRSLPKKSLAEICTVLHIPRNLWTDNGYKSDSIKYAFAGQKESAVLCLGTPDEKQNYNYARLTLHGNFFDHSPQFNAFDFLAALRKISPFTYKELDVCHIEQESTAVISVEQWIKFAEDYRLYFSGDMLRKSDVTIVREGRIFDRIQISTAGSKSAYGTIYRRDGMIRLEVKYRSKLDTVMESILKSPATFQQRAIDELSRQLEITTRGTAHTRKQKRHPLFAKYLAAPTNKIALVVLKAEQQKNRTVSTALKYDTDTKRVVGYLNNYMARHNGNLSTLLNEISDQTLEALREHLALLS